MNNPETVAREAPATDLAHTIRGGLYIAALVFAAPLYLAGFLWACGVAARAAHYAFAGF